MKSKILTVATIVIFAVIFLAAGESDYQEAKVAEVWSAGSRTEIEIVIGSKNGIAVLETADGRSFFLAKYDSEEVEDEITELYCYRIN